MHVVSDLSLKFGNTISVR